MQSITKYSQLNSVFLISGIIKITITSSNDLTVMCFNVNICLSYHRKNKIFHSTYRTSNDHVCPVGYRLPNYYSSKEFISHAQVIIVYPTQNVITSTKNYFFLYIFEKYFLIIICFLSINTRSEFIELISYALYLIKSPVFFQSSLPEKKCCDKTFVFVNGTHRFSSFTSGIIPSLDDTICSVKKNMYYVYRISVWIGCCPTDNS